MGFCALTGAPYMQVCFIVYELLCLVYGLLHHIWASAPRLAQRRACKQHSSQNNPCGLVPTSPLSFSLEHMAVDRVVAPSTFRGQDLGSAEARVCADELVFEAHRLLYHSA